jgi:DNA-binding GntR family transcriptional regulator
MKVPDTENLVDQLYKQIQERILSGQYPPGHKLRQEALANEFQVSRTPIREALSQLAAKGVIAYYPQTGAVVKHQSSKEMREIYHVRAQVEGFAAECAAQWITDDELNRLRNVHERFVDAVRALNTYRSTPGAEDRESSTATQEVKDAWIESNAEFHAIIYTASNNACLQRIINDLHLSYTRNVQSASALGMYKHRMENNIRHHQEVLTALEQRNPKQAREAMARHILESGEFIAGWLDNQRQS